MSWNQFPVLQPFFQPMTSSSQFPSKAYLDLSASTSSPFKTSEHQFKKIKTSKILDPSSNQDKFEQLLKKIQKVTQDFQQDHFSQSQNNFTGQRARLMFKQTIKSQNTQKKHNKQLRRARKIKKNEINHDSKDQNQIFALTSSFNFTLSEKKSHQLLNLTWSEFKNPTKVEISESRTQNISFNNKEKQNQLISQLNLSRSTGLKSQPQKIHKINFDLNILQKAPIRQSINLDGIDNLIDLQSIHQQNQFSFLLPQKKLKFSDFQLGNCIGSGKFGQVYICKHKRTNLLCALKKIMKSTIQEYKMEDQFIRELKISYMVDHPNIIKTYGHFDDQFHVFLLMQYAGDGSLIDNLQFNKSQRFSSNVLHQTMNAIDHLHRKRILHRDIKPQNIVVFFKDTYKLCDFGLSTFVNNHMKHTFCGTPDYLSPQMKDVGEYDFSVDLWSLGVLAYELITGYPPFKNKISEWKKSGWKKIAFWTWKVDYPKLISPIAKDFIQSLLKEKPQQRASIWNSLRHGFIKKHLIQEIDIIQMVKFLN